MEKSVCGPAGRSDQAIQNTPPVLVDDAVAGLK